MGKDMEKKSLAFLLILFLLLGISCRSRGKQTQEPRWIKKTGYPVSYLQALGDSTIGASAINTFWIFNKQNGEIVNAVRIIGTSASGMLFEKDRLYYGSNDHFFRCYDITQDRLLWNFQTLMPNEALPAVDSQNVYFGSRDFFFYAVDKDSGNLKWKFKTESPIYSIPILTDSLVLIGSWDTHFYALNKETGQISWKFTASAGIDQTPLVVDQTVWIANYDYHVYGIDLKTGQLKFDFSAENAFEFGGCRWKDLLIFTGIDRQIYFVNEARDTFLTKGISPFPVSTSPVVMGDWLFTGQYDGELYRWSLPDMNKEFLYHFDDHITVLLADSQHVWAASWDRTIACFDIEKKVVTTP
jgi:outer membrane protein assembly factor BamB